jgi:hypothetical protein
MFKPVAFQHKLFWLLLLEYQLEGAPAGTMRLTDDLNLKCAVIATGRHPLLGVGCTYHHLRVTLDRSKLVVSVGTWTVEAGWKHYLLNHFIMVR